MHVYTACSLVTLENSPLHYYLFWFVSIVTFGVRKHILLSTEGKLTSPHSPLLYPQNWPTAVLRRSQLWLPEREHGDQRLQQIQIIHNNMFVLSYINRNSLLSRCHRSVISVRTSFILTQIHRKRPWILYNNGGRIFRKLNWYIFPIVANIATLTICGGSSFSVYIVFNKPPTQFDGV